MPRHLPIVAAVAGAMLLSACATDGYYSDDGYYPDNRYPSGRYPDGRPYPDGRYPDARYPDARYPDARYPNQRYPDQRYPDQRYPDQRYPDQRYPDQRYPGQPYPDNRRPDTRPPDRDRGRTPQEATEDYNRAAGAQREDIVRRVQAALRADRRLGTSIVVESPSTGVIRLSGAPAGGQPAFGLAIDTARRVPGVREVENRLATY